MPKRKDENARVMSLEEVREMLRGEIKKRYGSVGKFLQSEDCAKLNTKYMKVYLYNSGSSNGKILNQLSELLNLGTLKKKVVVTREITYEFTPAGE